MYIYRYQEVMITYTYTRITRIHLLKIIWHVTFSFRSQLCTRIFSALLSLFFYRLYHSPKEFLLYRMRIGFENHVRLGNFFLQADSRVLKCCRHRNFSGKGVDDGQGHNFAFLFSFYDEDWIKRSYYNWFA